jgi:hypothetical protein
MIVGFAGLAGAGKNAAAEALSYPTLAFADALRQMLLRLDPVLYETHEGDAVRLTEVIERVGWDRAKREAPEVRRLLQELGMAVREINAYFFVDDLSNFIDMLVADGNNNLCVTDVRFPNELEMVRWWNGKVIWIERPGVENLGGPTENSITADDCDDFILNDGSIEKLHEKVRASVKVLSSD